MPKEFSAVSAVSQLEKHNHISFTLESQGDMVFKGTYRGRIQDKDHNYFNAKGTAIWVTNDNGFEMFIPINDITSLQR